MDDLDAALLAAPAWVPHDRRSRGSTGQNGSPVPPVARAGATREHPGRVRPGRTETPGVGNSDGIHRHASPIKREIGARTPRFATPIKRAYVPLGSAHKKGVALHPCARPKKDAASIAMDRP